MENKLDDLIKFINLLHLPLQNTYCNICKNDKLCIKLKCKNIFALKIEIKYIYEHCNNDVFLCYECNEKYNDDYKKCWCKDCYEKYYELSYK